MQFRKGMMTYPELTAFEGSIDQLDELIQWKAGSVSTLKHYKLDTITKGAYMQRQFTIEVRVNFADKDREDELKETMLNIADHAHATCALISDGGPKDVDVAVYSESWFESRSKIKRQGGVIQSGLDANPVTDADKPSQELLDALKG